MISRLIPLLLLVTVLLSCGQEAKAPAGSDFDIQPIPPGPVTLTNGTISLTVDPDYGARITSFKYRDKEVLRTREQGDAEGITWGSTVWTSPQADWDWPPPAVFDTEPYSGVRMRDNVYIFTSKLDTATGLQLEKRVQMTDAGEVGLRYRVTNETGMSVEVAAWENTRLPYAGRIEFFVSDTIYVDRGRLPVEIDEDDKGYIYFDEQHNEPQKIFATLRDTSVRYVNNGLVFTKQTMITARNQTVEGAMPLEVFMDPQRGFAEFELQGGTYTLETGQTATMHVKWLLREE